MDEQTVREDFSHLSKNLFITQKKHAEKTKGNYFCSCSLCVLQNRTTHTHSEINQAKEDYANYEGKEKSFTWLLKELGKASKDNDIKINIPETIVFSKSKAIFFIYQKGDRCIKMTTSQQKLKLSELRKLFNSLARQRKREEFPTMKPAKPEAYGKEVALVRYMLRDFDNESPFIPASYEAGALRVMTEIEFSDLMVERAGSSIWRRISYIQAVVKCKVGISETHIVTYYSHDANDSQALAELQEAGKDENDQIENSLSGDLHKYCEFVCKKIAYILAVYAQQELLRFCPEFLIDDNGKIWLSYANKISVREIEINDRDQEILFKRVELRNVESKERLNEELHSGVNDAKTPHQLRMLSEMSKHYGDLKHRMGINEMFKDKPRDPLSNQAFVKLRPFSPYNLYQVIDPESRRLLEEKYKNQRKVQKKTVFHKPLHRNARQESVRSAWTMGKQLQTSSARVLPRTSSRFSENLKEWLKPTRPNCVSVYEL